MCVPTACIASKWAGDVHATGEVRLSHMHCKTRKARLHNNRSTRKIEYRIENNIQDRRIGIDPPART
eukprot:8095968-Alexandrium_andersonii.AAC.1